MVQIEVNRAVAQNVRRLPLNCCDCWTIYKWWTVRQKIYNISNKEQICTVPATSWRPVAKSNGGKLLLSNLVLIIISENTDATNWSQLFFHVILNQAENMYELINLTLCVVQCWQTVHFGIFSMFCFLGPLMVSNCPWWVKSFTNGWLSTTDLGDEKMCCHWRRDKTDFGTDKSMMSLTGGLNWHDDKNTWPFILLKATMIFLLKSHNLFSHTIYFELSRTTICRFALTCQVPIETIAQTFF